MDPLWKCWADRFERKIVRCQRRHHREEAISEIKNGQTAEADNVGPDLLTFPHCSLNSNEGKMINEWREEPLPKLPKKSNITNCHNWRSFYSILSKVMSRVILNRDSDTNMQRTSAFHEIPIIHISNKHVTNQYWTVYEYALAYIVFSWTSTRHLCHWKGTPCGDHSEPFTVNSGVQKGGVVSPTIFLSFLTKT